MCWWDVKPYSINQSIDQVMYLNHNTCFTDGSVSLKVGVWVHCGSADVVAFVGRCIVDLVIRVKNDFRDVW